MDTDGHGFCHKKAQKAQNKLEQKETKETKMFFDSARSWLPW
jgi:hypothetical protein